MGSPSLSSSRSSWIDRPTSWWKRSGDRKPEAPAKLDETMKETQSESVQAPPTLIFVRKQPDLNVRRGSSGLAGLGSGTERVRRIYAQKKTDLTVEGTPWY